MKMTPSTVLRFTGCILFLLPPTAVHAELISADDPRFGQNSITIDAATGLGWLDITCTTNLSYNQAEALRAPGQLLAGFRHATTNEILRLFLDAGIPGPGYYSGSSQITTSIMSLINLLGPNDNFVGRPEVMAITGSAYNFPNSGLMEVDDLQ